MAEELDEAERAEAWFDGLAALATLHALDCNSEFDFLRRPRRGARGLDQYLDWVRDWYVWMRGGREYPIVEAAFDHLFAHKPRDAPDCVLWGDARIGNVMDRSESIAYYERARGHPVQHIEYYEIFAALRFALVLIRAAERYRSVGLVAPDTTFGSHSPPMRLLAQQLGLAVPELSPDIRRLMARPFDEKTRAATSA